MLFILWKLSVYLLTLAAFYKNAFKLNLENLSAQSSAPVPELPGAVAGTMCEIDTYGKVPMHVAGCV